MPDRTPHELARYWDELTIGSVPSPVAFDPSLAEAIRRFERAEDVPGADPTFVANLMEDLMHATTLFQPVSRDRPGWTSPEAHRPIRGRLGWPPLALPAFGSRWFAILASAALVLLTIGVAGYAILDRDGSSSPGGPAVHAPATPASIPEDDGVLLEFPLPSEALPADGSAGMSGVRYFTMAPNTSTSWDGPRNGSLNPGMWVDYILAGSMSMTAQGTADVIRGGGALESVPAGTEIVLEPGDTVIHRVEEFAEWTSTGPTEVDIVSMLLLDNDFVSYPQPSGWHETGYHTDWSEPLPAGNWMVRLEERELEPDEAISAPARPTVHYAVAEPGSRAYMSEGSADQLTLRSADAPTTVYVFTLEWLGESDATPEP